MKSNNYHHKYGNTRNIDFFAQIFSILFNFGRDMSIVSMSKSTAMVSSQ